MPQPLPPKQGWPSQGLTVADIPSIVDAFIEAKDGCYTQHLPLDSDEEPHTEDNGASVSSESPLTDKELSADNDEDLT